MIRDKEGHYIMIKISIQEDIIIINIKAPNIGALQYVRQMQYVRQTKAQNQMASQVNSTKNLEKS